MIEEDHEEDHDGEVVRRSREGSFVLN